ncbi:PAS domain-containing protein [Polyangium aurulentum]|uniref:PAS domain-containing protein n=1 Tax=Polyangium aurulentum TaxID=2567896 RepID=UPI0010AEE021|nr:STAS domain-containing protein [Polyangium aurulentum]UQA58620.1 PAS domain-containing protein [Polyangium aurulentum]
MSAVRDEHAIRFQHFFRTSRDLLCVMKGDGRLVLTNQAFRDTLGYSEDSLQGEDFARLVHPEDAAPLRDFMSSAGSGAALMKLNARFLHRDLSHRRIIFTLERVNGDREVYGSGIEAEAQAPVDEWQRRRELLQKMQSTARVGGWEVDCQTSNQYWTEETYRIHEVPVGFDPRVDTGISFYSPEAQPVIHAAWGACVSEGKPYDLELQIITAKGRRLWVRTAATPVMENGKVTRVLGAFQDIDDFKRREIELEEKLAIIEQQRSKITALSAPIIQVWDDVLALPVVGGLEQERATEITERLLDAIVSNAARFAILDLTGVDAVDEGTAEHLVRILRAIRLLGAEGLVTGIRPGVAQMLTSLGAELAGVRTLSNLREAIKVCMRERTAKASRGAR